MAEGFIEFKKDDLTTQRGISELNRMLRTLYDNLPGDTERVRDFQGYGTPENNISAQVGSTYRRLDGGASTSFYIKESGDGTDTGWVAK